MTDAPNRTSGLLRSFDEREIVENIDWWTDRRNKHEVKGEHAAVSACNEEIALWIQELADVRNG